MIAVGALVLLAGTIITQQLLWNSKEFTQHAETLRAVYITQQKDLIKREVMRAVTLIRERYSHSLKMTQDSVKQRTENAVAIAQNIYAQNKNTKTANEIQQMILDALRPVRYAQGSGYYFITRIDGQEILFADKPELEGTNLLHVQDSHGQFVVKDMIAIVRESGEGFYQYLWSKPGVVGRNHKKVSYVKYFEPYNWVIGTGLYPEDFDNQIKRNVLTALSQMRFGKNGYLFVNKLNGDVLLANGKFISGGQKLWEVFSADPAKTKALFALEHAAALKPDGDFINYSMSKLTDSDKEYPKTSFIYGIPELQWLIGAGVYLDEIEVSIAALQHNLDQQQREKIEKTLFTTGLFVLIVLLLLYVVSRFLSRDMEAFVDFFNRAAYEGEEIDSDKIYFYGLSKIAESANTVLRDRQKALEQIKLSEEKYRNLFETSLAGLFRTRLSDGLLLAANAKAAELLGCTVEESVGKLKAVDLVADLDKRQQLLETLAVHGFVNDYEVELILPDGRHRFYSVSARLYPEEDRLEGVAIDITERKRAETLLRESEERFRDLAELLPEAVFETDIDLTLTYANRQALEIFGYSEGTALETMNSADIFHPDEMQKLLANVELQFRGEKTERTEYKCIKKDGTVFPALFRVCPIFKEGQPAGIRGVVIDLTEQRRAEEEIFKLRKLESVGILAGGIAHDFNNLLAGLFGNIEMAKRFLDKDHRAYKYLKSAGLSMERATGLTQQLLTFAKGGDPIKEVLSLEGVIEETARFSLRGSKIKLCLDLAADLWLVDADKGQLSQVISNLVINGKQAMPDGGEMTISAENVENSQGPQVKICIQDQGVGIAPQHLDKIFDPYFSTKQQGSGLGLATCYSIIAKHNGTIKVTSEINQGTCFTILLPVAEKPLEANKVISDAQISATGVKARILVLDDEEIVQQMSGTMLEEMGHQPDYAAHGEMAVTLWQQAREAGNGYDLVICDLTIPGGMGGQEAAAEILRIDPAAKLIVSSGYATDPIMAHFVDYGFKGRIAKPYRFAELQKEVERVLAI